MTDVELNSGTFFFFNLGNQNLLVPVLDVTVPLGRFLHFLLTSFYIDLIFSRNIKMKRKVPFLIITASTVITWLILLLPFTYIWPGMGWLSLSLNCPLTPNPITPSLHLSFQQLFDRKNHKKRRKAFPRSCPLKIKDSVALSPDQMNAWRHLKLRNPSGISPLSKNDLAS